MAFDEVVTCASVSAKASFIVKQAAIGPVLVYCKQALAAELVGTGCDPLLVTEDTDPKLLVDLDSVLETGAYRVLVALEQVTMRGYNYRSKCQMTLAID